MNGPDKKVEVLIAAQNVESVESMPFAAHQSLSEGSSVLMINQTSDPAGFKGNTENLRVRSFDESGISRSRNRALSEAAGDLLLITDDDVELIEGFSTIIQEAFEMNPSADIITFQTQDLNGQNRKNYPKRSHSHDVRSLMRVSSIEMAIRREALDKNPVNFDERFGLGSRWPTGEESIYLADALSKGLRILYLPLAIARHPDFSSGGALYKNEKLIRAKGSMMYRIFGWKAYLVGIYFALSKRSEMGLSLLRSVQLIFSGISEFKSLDHET